MAQVVITNKLDGAAVRDALNSMFEELYAGAGGSTGSGTGTTTYATLVLAKAVTDAENNDVCFVTETGTFYTYVTAGSALTANDTSVLTTGAGGDTRWKGISGKYVYETIYPNAISLGGQSINDIVTTIRAAGSALDTAAASELAIRTEIDGITSAIVAPDLGSFDSTDLTAGVLTKAHNFTVNGTTQFVDVVLYDNNKKRVQAGYTYYPTSGSVTSSVDIDLSALVPTLSTNTWYYKISYGAGPQGGTGPTGDDSYTYVAYASDNTGTGFSLTPTDELKYRAEIHEIEEIESLQASDFSAATWIKYIGDNGSDASVTAENVNIAGAVMETDYSANTILAANTNDTPAPLTIAEQRLVGRITGGNIIGLTPTEIRTLINVEDGASASGGITTYADVTAAEAASGSNTELCYVVSTKTIYEYISAGSAYTDDNLFVLSTNDGGDTRWVGVGGAYVYPTSNFKSVAMAISSVPSIETAGREVISSDFGKIIKANSASDLTFPLVNGTADGQDIWFSPVATGSCITTGLFIDNGTNYTTMTGAVKGGMIHLKWDVTIGRWQVAGGSTTWTGSN